MPDRRAVGVQAACTKRASRGSQTAPPAPESGDALGAVADCPRSASRCSDKGDAHSSAHLATPPHPGGGDITVLAVVPSRGPIAQSLGDDVEDLSDVFGKPEGAPGPRLDDDAEDLSDVIGNPEVSPAAHMDDDAEVISDACRPPTNATGGRSASLSAAIELWECPRAFYRKRMIIDIGGRNAHHIQDRTGTKVWYCASPLQLELRANSADGLRKAMVMVQDLVETVRSAFDRWMEERALQSARHRCQRS